MSKRDPLPLAINYLENEYVGKVLTTFKNSFIPDEFKELITIKDVDTSHLLKPIIVTIKKDDDLYQIMKLTLSHINKAEFRYFF